MAKSKRPSKGDESKLTAEAESVRTEAALLPEGPAKEALLKKARRLDTASHVQDWITSPGLKPPRE